MRNGGFGNRRRLRGVSPATCLNNLGARSSRFNTRSGLRPVFLFLFGRPLLQPLIIG